MTERNELMRDVTIKAKGVVLRLVEESDAEFIVNLRTIEGSKQFVSEAVPTVDEQLRWIRQYKDREAKGEDLYFIFEDNDQKPWGTVRFYRFTEDSFYFGSWISLPDNKDSIAIKAQIAGFDYMYTVLGFTVGKLDIRKANSKVWKFAKLWGSKMVDEDELSYFLELKKEMHFANRDKILRLLKIDL